MHLSGTLSAFLNGNPFGASKGCRLLFDASDTSLEDFCIRELRVQIGTSPFVYRFIDWSITARLQILEFYLILFALQPDSSPAMFWRLMQLAFVAMLAFG